MTVRVYRSDDASAPTLNGTVGSLIAVLDACLVNGYGSKAAAGWAKAFSGTNLAAYRAASGIRHYLRVDDTAAQEARIIGYETMTTDINGGASPFPTSTQQSGGLFVRKSNTADSTARPWMLISNGVFFYFLPFTGITALNGDVAASDIAGTFCFGEFISYKPGDAYSTIIIGAIATGQSQSVFGVTVSPTTWFAAPNGHFIARAYTQSGTSRTVTKMVPGDPHGATLMGGASHPVYPDVVSGGIPLGPVEILEPDGSNIPIQRGRLPGLWVPFVALPGSQLDTFTCSGELSGKTMTLMTVGNTSTLGRAAFETSDTW